MSERIDIVVTAQGAVTVRQQIAGIGTEAATAQKPVDTLQRALNGLITAAAIQQIVKYSDAYTNINNRLKLVSSSTDELRSTQQALFQQAQASYQSYEGLVQIYQRAATALLPLGKNTQDVLAFTDLLSKSVALSGVSADSANAALVQLSQGMASGTLRGEELNSVLEQLPYVASQIAAGMGITVGALRSLAMQGKITPQVILDAFKKMSTSINQDFATITPTISMAFQQLSNGLIEVVGNANNSTGIFNIFALAISFVAQNLDVLSYALVPVIAAFVAIGAAALMGALIQGFGLLAGAITVTSTAVIGLTTALLTNPIFLVGSAVAIGLAAIITLMYQFADTFKPIIDWLNELWAKFSDVIGSIQKALQELGILKDGSINIELKGIDAAKDIKGAMTDGGKDAADKLKDALTKGGTDLAKKTKDAVVGGSTTGGQIMGNNIQSGGQKAGKTLEQAALDGTAKGIQTGIEGLTTVFDVWLNKVRAETGNINADTNLKYAEAQRLYTQSQLEQAAAVRNRNQYTSSGSAATPGYKNGGSFRVGGSGGTDSQNVQFRASPNERVTVETPAQQRASDNSNTPVIDNKTTIVNSFDPAAMGAFLQTAAGAKVIKNVVQADLPTYRRLLGS